MNNRIKELRYVKASELAPDPRNPRRHPAAKSRLLYEVYPQYVKLVMRYGRPHHYVNYKRYWKKWPRLKRKQGLDLPTEPDNYGLTMREIPRGGRVKGLRTGQRAVRELESE